MGLPLGAIAGFIGTIFFTKFLSKSGMGRKIGIILAVICLVFNCNNDGAVLKICDNYYFEDIPFPLALIEGFLEIFMFCFVIGGIVLMVIEFIHFGIKYQNDNEHTKNNNISTKGFSDSTKWVLTVIFAVIAIACACTGILIPITYGCGQIIKSIWRNNETN